MAALQQRVRGDSRGDRLPVQHPDALGLRRRRRASTSCCRTAAARSASTQLGEQTRQVPRRRARSGPSSATCSPPSTRTTRRSRSTSTARRRARSACRSTKSSRRCRRRSAAPTSTTSTASGACTASTCRPRPSYRRKPEDIGEIYVRSQTTNDDDPALDAGRPSRRRRHASSPRASTCSARSRSAARRRRGYTSGQALAALEAVFAETMPTEMGFAYSVAVLPGEDRAARRCRRSSWRSCSCSCCWPRCTRAGGCRGRCCSARRWSRSAPSSASG